MKLGSHVMSHNIIDKLIFNADQTPSKYVSTSKVTMAEQGSKHVSISGGNDKRSTTLTIIESMAGEMLQLQVIYQGITERCLPQDACNDKNFVFSYNKSHEIDTLRMIDRILVPYIRKVMADFNLESNQKSLLIWDALKAQSTPQVKPD